MSEDLQVAPHRRPRPSRARVLFSSVLLAAVAVLVAAGALILWRKPPPESAAPARSAIAVLPFQNLSAEGPHGYFAGGLHDELLTQLSKVGALKGTSKPLKTIATELGVGSVVEGSVQVVGERLRVHVQLIDDPRFQALLAKYR